MTAAEEEVVVSPAPASEMGALDIRILDRHADLDARESMFAGVGDDSECSFFLSWNWIENWLSSPPDAVSVSPQVCLDNGAPAAPFFLGRARAVRHGRISGSGLTLKATGITRHDELCVGFDARDEVVGLADVVGAVGA